MDLRLILLLAVMVGAMVWWYRVNTQAHRTIAKFRSEAELLHGERVKLAQEKFDLAEVAFRKDGSDVNRRALHEASYELQAVKKTL